MAEPVFDQHPLELYLQESEESSIPLMPGNIHEFLAELEHGEDNDNEGDEGQTSVPSFLEQALLVLSSVYATYRANSNWSRRILVSGSPSSSFAERFKYDVISSSLLATSLPLPHAHSHIPSAASRYRGSPSRTASTVDLDPDQDPTHETISLSFTPPRAEAPRSFNSMTLTTQSWIIFLSAIIILFLSTGYYFMAVIALSFSAMVALRSESEILAWLPHTFHDMLSNQTQERDMTPSLDTLHELITSSALWDSIVQEAITVLEKDDRASHLSGSTSPTSPLRVALSSSLQTTQTHCDNVRHLFMALTSPAELVQLSEMYAPPSPEPFVPAAPSHGRSSSSPVSPAIPGLRPMSLPAEAQIQTTDRTTKRTTWSGFNPNGPFLKRRDKRRSELSNVFLVSSAASPSGSVSLPVTPIPPPGILKEVAEEDAEGEVEEEERLGSGYTSPGQHSDTFLFGSAALSLRRQRKSQGMDAFGLLSPSTPHTPRTPASPGGRSLRSSASNTSLGSRFTTLQTPTSATRSKQPGNVSISTLRNALNGALASKRYACSHLLALRFQEEEGDGSEGYWEDVCSIMGLLTTALDNARSKIEEALDDVQRIKRRFEQASPESVDGHDRMTELLESQRQEEDSPLKPKSKISPRAQIFSFAPMPNHLSRFAAHVQAISAALDDARENLEECVSSLRQGQGHERHTSGSCMSASPRASSPHNLEDAESPLEVQQHPALQAYERLRRELGLALRECERGRERLLDITAPPRSYEEDLGAITSDPDLDDLPGLAHDAEAEESDRPESSSTSPSELLILMELHNELDQVKIASAGVDDYTPPGIEQVFEAESGTDAPFGRERSKLSREERIALVKKLREGGMRNIHGRTMSLSIPPPLGPGIGIEVVQELKDVIWKVGEKRRRRDQATQSVSLPTVSEPITRTEVSSVQPIPDVI